MTTELGFPVRERGLRPPRLQSAVLRQGISTSPLSAASRSGHAPHQLRGPGGVAIATCVHTPGGRAGRGQPAGDSAGARPGGLARSGPSASRPAPALGGGRSVGFFLRPGECGTEGGRIRGPDGAQPLRSQGLEGIDGGPGPIPGLNSSLIQARVARNSPEKASNTISSLLSTAPTAPPRSLRGNSGPSLAPAPGRRGGGGGRGTAGIKRGISVSRDLWTATHAVVRDTPPLPDLSFFKEL